MSVCLFTTSGRDVKQSSQAALTGQQDQSTFRGQTLRRSSATLHSSVHNEDLVSKSVCSLHGLALPLFALRTTSHSSGFCQDVRETGFRSPSRNGSERVNLWLCCKYHKQWVAYSVSLWRSDSLQLGLRLLVMLS